MQEDCRRRIGSSTLRSSLSAVRVQRCQTGKELQPANQQRRNRLFRRTGSAQVTSLWSNGQSRGKWPIANKKREMIMRSNFMRSKFIFFMRSNFRSWDRISICSWGRICLIKSIKRLTLQSWDRNSKKELLGISISWLVCWFQVRSWDWNSK